MLFPHLTPLGSFFLLQCIHRLLGQHVPDHTVAFLYLRRSLYTSVTPSNSSPSSRLFLESVKDTLTFNHVRIYRFASGTEETILMYLPCFWFILR